MNTLLADVSRRALILVNAAIRAGYGIGALLAPQASARARLAPSLEDRPEARLFVRGFAAHQVAVAGLGIASLRRQDLELPAIAAAVAIDATDVISAVVEGRARGRFDEDLVGGIVFSTTGVVAGVAAYVVGLRDRKPRNSSSQGCAERASERSV